MPATYDLLRRIREVAEETDRQAESLELRADRAEERALKSNNDPDTASGTMRENAYARRRDARFLADLAEELVDQDLDDVARALL